MNLFRNSLVSSLRALGLRRRGDIGFDLIRWKIFSVHNSMQYNDSNRRWTSNNLYDSTEVEKGLKTKSERPRDDIYFEEEEESGSFDGEGVSERNNRFSTGAFTNLFGSRRSMGREFDFEEDNKEREHANVGNRNYRHGYSGQYRNHQKGYRNNNNGRMSFNKNNVYYDMDDTHLDKTRASKREMLHVEHKIYPNEMVFRKLVKIPRMSPLIWNMYVSQTSIFRENYFFARGHHFMKCCIEKGVQPAKVFVSNTNNLKFLEFTSDDTEFYCVDNFTFEKCFGVLEIGICGFFSKEKLKEIAANIKQVFPVTIVCHGFSGYRSMDSILREARILGTGKIITTLGTKTCYTGTAVERFLRGVCTLPIRENARWDDIDQLISSEEDYEVFLIGPGEGAPAPSKKKKNPLSIPVSDIITTDFWAKEKLFLIISEKVIEEDEALLNYCKKWKARKLILPEVTNVFTLTMATVALWEMNKQHKCSNLSSTSDQEEH